MLWKRKVEMPLDWTDQQGWERYYASLYPNGKYTEHDRDTGSFFVDRLPDFVACLKQEGWTTVWVPGCGLSPLAKLLAGLGMNVHATDISSSAIAFQRGEANDITDLLKPLNVEGVQPGSLTCVVQDFRTPYQENFFDLILNVKAFQGFPADAMAQIARSHFLALKPGRQAYFDTMNVQGERRDILEASLVNAGFVIPYYELTLWYRKRLQETGIPHLFILGQPRIPRQGVYATDDALWKQDRERLMQITREYQTRAQEQQEEEQKRITPEARVATVIYSTG